MKTYDEFKTEWLAKCDTSEDNFVVNDELLEWFCECDYKRYTGEWKETL